jgi:hypothetical protein
MNANEFSDPQAEAIWSATFTTSHQHALKHGADWRFAIKQATDDASAALDEFNKLFRTIDNT